MSDWNRWMSTPVSNILQNDMEKWMEWLHEYNGLCYLKGTQRFVPYLKDRLGRQNYCYTTWVRNWVWERENHWRAFVSKRGLSFEVNPDYTPDQVLEAWRDFLVASQHDPKFIRDTFTEVLREL